VAVASNNTRLLWPLATYVTKSPDPEDNALQAELAQTVSDKLDTIDTSSAQTGATGGSTADAAATGASATATAVLRSVTPTRTRASMFLGDAGDAGGPLAGSPLKPSFLRAPTVPAINASSAQTAQHVHLRDSNVTPAADLLLGGIQGVIAPGQHVDVADVTFVKISGGSAPKYAAWAKVSIFPAASSSC
jgi:hypothetical protein